MQPALSPRYQSAPIPRSRIRCWRWLAFGLLSLVFAVSLPAHAADPGCQNPDGTPKAGSTDQGSEYGISNSTCDVTASAFGYFNAASGFASSAFGHGNTASGYVSSAFGSNNHATGDFSSAYGSFNTASGDVSNAFGYSNSANGVRSVAFGSLNTASGDYSSAFGFRNYAAGEGSSAFGVASATLGAGGTAVGSWYDLNGNGVIDDISEQTFTSGLASSAFGAAAHAIGDFSVAVGAGAKASAPGSAALGQGAVADEANTVSVGTTGSERRIVHVAAAIADSDTVVLAQLYPFTSALGGGAGFAGGVFTAPTYLIQSGSYNNVSAAFGAVDSTLTDLYAKLAGAGGIPGPKGDKGDPGAAGPQGATGPAGGGPLAMSYDGMDFSTVTLKGTGGSVIANVAEGVAASDAVNRSQLDAQTQQAIDSAKTYSDAMSTQTLNSAKAYTDHRIAALVDSGVDQLRSEMNTRFATQDERISKTSAMGTAMVQMAASAAGIDAPNRIGVGVGATHGKSALAVGYQRAINKNATFTIGGSATSGESTVGAGVGFGW